MDTPFLNRAFNVMWTLRVRYASNLMFMEHGVGGGALLAFNTVYLLQQMWKLSPVSFKLCPL